MLWWWMLWWFVKALLANIVVDGAGWEVYFVVMLDIVVVDFVIVDVVVVDM